MASPSGPQPRPLRLLIVLPSWVGDAVMATPALRLIRDSLLGSFIGGLVRPGIDEVLAGTDLLDEVHLRAPAYVTLASLPLMSKNLFVSDVVAIIGSIDIVLGEIDR